MAEPLASDIAVGSYRLSKNDGYEGFLIRLGIGEMQRRELLAATPTITIVKEGDEWSITETSALGAKETRFKMAEVFYDVLLNGTRTMCIASESGLHWSLMHAHLDGSDDVSVHFNFSDNQLRVRLDVENLMAFRDFERIQRNDALSLMRHPHLTLLYCYKKVLVV